MWLRRAFYWVQLAAAIALPAWIVVARSIAPESLGAQDVIVFLAWPALALMMVIVIGVTWGRRSVRADRTLSWIDVGALSLWYAVAIVYGMFISVSSSLGAGITGGLLALVSIGVFWVAVWQLIVAARKRVETVLAGLDYTAIPAGEYQASRIPPGDGDVIRIHPPRE